MYTGNIIDTHMHLWDLKNNYSWLETNVSVFEYLGGNYDRLKHNFLVPDYIALTHQHHVTKSIHLEAFGFGGNPILETKWLQSQADHFGFPHGIVAHADLHDPDVESLLKQHCQYPNVCGIRMGLNYHENPLLCMTDRGDYLQDKQWQKGFALLAKYDLSFDLQIYDHQIEDAVTLIRQFPDTMVVLEHFAWPLDLSEQGFQKWQERMSLIAECHNVFIKLSGIGWVFQHSTFETIKQYITTAIQLFGINRCMFGSNFPPDSLFYNFDDLIHTFKRILADYSPDDQYRFFYGNAQIVYRL